MSTLNEIAANHARMAKALAEGPTAIGDRQAQVVGGFDISSIDGQQPVVLHLIAGMQDNPIGLAGYSL